MTFRAILDDGKVHAPLQYLLRRKMTPRQVDKEYSGTIGMCPDCEAFFAENNPFDGSTFAAAVLDKDRRVRYRCGCYSGEQILRQMHFKHAAGYLADGLIAPCTNVNRALHTEAVAAIASFYEDDLPPGFKVVPECQFVKAGTPPETYRPDIAITNQFGGKYMCVEYQRRSERFESLVHRHEVRASEWGQVVWFFDRAIWELSSTKQARDWLWQNRQDFYVCWVDEQNFQLQAEAGTYATQIVQPPQKIRLKQFELRGCSVADVINAYEQAIGQAPAVEKKIAVDNRPVADATKGVNFVERAKEAKLAEAKQWENIKQKIDELEERKRQSEEQRRENEKRQRERNYLNVTAQRDNWQKVKAEPCRGGSELLLNVRPGDRIRRDAYTDPETYKGVTGAGFSTDKHTYSSLRGWSVYKKAS